MNYRHAFHAGNFADVLKHWVLLRLLDRLAAKPKPFFVLDTHAGSGFYDLAREATGRTGEAEAGIGRLLPHAEAAPESLRPYLSAITALNEDEPAPRWYPGSPYLIASALRDSDRLIACDLEAGEGGMLRETLKPFRRAKAHLGDGYAAIPSMLPPPERRGLVLIDPPFERRDEFDSLAKAAARAHAHFPTGLLALWYPIKDREAVARFLDRLPTPAGGLAAIDFALDTARADMGLRACGLALVNPPFGLFEEIAETLPWLVDVLGATPHAAARIDWLAEPA